MAADDPIEHRPPEGSLRVAFIHALREARCWLGLHADCLTGSQNTRLWMPNAVRHHFKKPASRLLVLGDDRAVLQIVKQLLRFHLHPLADDGIGDIILGG